MTRRNTKRQIMDAAKRIFAEKGYDASSLDDIAREAQVKKALIFYYFPSKETLFLEAWNEGIDELEHHLFSEIEGESIYIRKLKKLLKAYVDFVMGRKDIMKLIEMDKMKILKSPSREKENWSSLKKRYALFIQHIEELIDEGKQKKVLPPSISTHSTARLIAETMGMGVTDEELSLDQLVQFILMGMSLGAEGVTPT
ncbi:MAG TPA: TetR/AcrR family transcriptional regulator [Thermotogota bacterium]|nr:TetR/AcrR family transcriptional regulator [Thermotogota bacterium]HRW91441.1 TetR/AcrR family transcriptional regulator [Thermotogota bacterium]